MIGGGLFRNILGRLAGSSDAGEGAALVADKGTTVSAALALDKRRPRKVFSKLFASASAAAGLRVVMLGDSLAPAKLGQFVASLDRRMGGRDPNGVNTAGNVAGMGVVTRGVDLGPTATVLVTDETLKYEYWPTGQVTRIDAGGSAGWITSGANPTFTNVSVYYVKEPGAGTINLLVGGATVATASADAAVGLGVLTYAQAAAQASVSTTVTGAAVRVLMVHMENTANSGVDLFITMNRGGLQLTDATSSAQGRALWQAALQQIAPDFITQEWDDSFGDGGVNTAAFELLVGILDAACPNADKLVIGSTPRAAADAEKLAASDYLRGLVAAKGADWLFFDSYRLMGTYAEMVAIFGADDGVHPTAAAQAFAAEQLWCALGLDSANLGYVPRAVNDVSLASKFATDSRFYGPGSNFLGFKTDVFGFDWDLSVPRTLTLKKSTDGSFGGWQFSLNTAVNPHVMPIGLDFVSAGNVRKLTTSTSTGVEFTRFLKTDNPGGGRMHIECGLVRNGFTRAELLAINANSVMGALAFCSDCTGGAQWVYARGSGAADWVTVDGKTGI